MHETADPLSLEVFSARLGEPFRVHLDDGALLELRLAAADGLGEAMLPGGRVPFSIRFGGPSQPILPQRIYALTHERLGRLELFLVPLAPDATGTRYEAVFT